MLALKAVLAMPGLIGVLTFVGLSFSAHAPTHSVKPSARTARIATAAPPRARVNQAPALNHRYSRAADGLFYVIGRVNGVKVRFLLDTGATMVVLTPADAARVGAPRSTTSRHSVMDTAAGPSAIDRITLDRVAIAGHTVADVDAAVVRRGLKVSLLGQDLLSQLGPVTISGNQLELN